MKKKIAVFVSGSGSDLQSIIDAIKAKEVSAKIVRVIASKDGIFAIERAKTNGIPVSVFKKADYIDASAMFEEIIKTLKKDRVKLIVLAGYLTILTPNIVRAYPRSIINIHPSLIPAYCGDGFYGMKVHEAVIKNKEKLSGATVHFVDEGTDTGDIILQESVEVFEDDTAETLQKRVLELEHKILPIALQKVIKSN